MRDLLTPEEASQLDALSQRQSYVREALQQVSRLTRSRRFDRVQQRAKDFLTFVVAKTLLGQADQIKEVVIAIAVFEQSADFDPAESSMVRVAAGELRQRLADYAEDEGRQDPIEITIPLNTYVPDIRDRRPALTVIRFENWHPKQEQGYLCETIAAELAFRLEAAGFRASVGNVPTGGAGPRYVVRGAIEPQDATLRINISLAEPEAKRILVSRSFAGRRNDVLKMARDVADALQAVLQAEDNVSAKAGVRAGKSGSVSRRQS